MRKIKSKNTTPEVIFRKALWKNNIRYRIENKGIIGNPDIAIKKYQIAIFIDGEFWHGFNWMEKKAKIKSNREYWIQKIERNIERDNIYNQLLRNQKWIVLRFWEYEIKKNLNKCVEIVKSALNMQSSILASHSKKAEHDLRACQPIPIVDREKARNFD